MKTIQAVYENGVFKPKVPVTLPPGSEVDVLMPDDPENPVAILKARFPNSFGGLAQEDAREIMQVIEEECEQIDPDAWR